MLTRLTAMVAEDVGSRGRPRRLRRPRAGAMLLAVLLSAAAVAGLVGGPERSPSAGGRPAGAGSSPPAIELRPVPAPDGPAGAQAVAAVTATLDRRAAALRRRDPAGWLAGVDPQSAGFRAAQAALFTRLSRLPITAWRYDLTGTEAAPEARAAPLGPGAFVAEVTLSYRLGPDTRDVERQQYLTVVRHGNSWALASDADGPTQRDLWDLGPITVARGLHSLVIGDGSPRTLLSGIAAETDAAVARVDAAWGTGWPRTVVVVVPATMGRLATLLGRPDDAALAELAAVTTGPLDRDPSGLAPPDGTADRVVLNLSAYRALSGLGRRVVLTHEVTHVATRSAAVATPPTWLEEGFADYLAYRGTGLPETAVAGQTLAAAGRGTLPGRLPDTAAFDPARGPIETAYEQAWLACTLITGAGGAGSPGGSGSPGDAGSSGDPARLVAFYRIATAITVLPGLPRATASGPTPESALLAAAFRTVTGGSQDQFVVRWRASIAAAAGGHA